MTTDQRLEALEAAVLALQDDNNALKEIMAMLVQETGSKLVELHWVPEGTTDSVN